MAPGIPIFEEFKSAIETISQWIDRLENHLELQEVTTEAKKKSAILAFVGAEAYGRLNDRAKPQKSAKDLSYDEITKTLKLIFEPKKNKYSERSNFRRIRQQSGESFSEYENRLRHGAIHCKFADGQLEERLIEQFIEGLSNRQVVQNLLMKAESDENFKTLEYVSNLAATILMVQKASASSSGSTPAAEEIVIHKLHAGFKKRTQKYTTKASQNSSSNPQQSSTKDSAKPTSRRFPTKPGSKCYRCGGQNHMANACRFISATCNGCGLVGHLQSVCRKSQPRHNYIEEHQLHNVQSKTPIFVDIEIDGQKVRMEVDTGSEVSTMHLNQFLQISPHCRRIQNDLQLKTATGQPFRPDSFVEVSASYGGCSKQLRLYLIQDDSFPSLLG